ncbi:MAG: hypothetical protein GKR87_09465 [Kiritimatiellae bacterium]|nr:hypothetical protein [Kiritimatiellia bacterium]
MFIANIVLNPTPGATIDLGTLDLTPVDQNGNNISDSWEDTHLVGSINVGGADDPDHDQFSNWDQYIAGTDPLDEESVLAFQSISPTNGVPRMTWSGVSGRRYRIWETDNLARGIWVPAFDPLTASATQSDMQWTDINATSNHQIYRLEVDVPQ